MCVVVVFLFFLCCFCYDTSFFEIYTLFILFALLMIIGLCFYFQPALLLFAVFFVSSPPFWFFADGLVSWRLFWFLAAVLFSWRECWFLAGVLVLSGVFKILPVGIVHVCGSVSTRALLPSSACVHV